MRNLKTLCLAFFDCLTNFRILFLLFPFLLSDCDTREGDPVPLVTSINVPAEEFTRENDFMGCVNPDDRKVKIEIWGYGFSLYKIYKLYLNGKMIFHGEILPFAQKQSFSLELPQNGFNYLNFYSANGTNIEAIVSIDGVTTDVRANSAKNGYINVVAENKDVVCPDSGLNHTDLLVYTGNDPMCGFFQVELVGVGKKTMTKYFSTAPPCGTDGAATFEDLPAGEYDLVVYCGNTIENPVKIYIDGSPVCQKRRID